MTKQKKRFIAGAVCPRCAQMDKLFVYRIDDRNFRECVHCEFLEEQQFTPIQHEPTTRVTRDTGVNKEQIVRLVTPPKNSP